MTSPLIASDTKHHEAANHLKWLDSLPTGTILLSTHGSKTDTGRTASAWACKATTRGGLKPIFHEACFLGTRYNIEDGKIHAIQEGLPALAGLGTSERPIDVTGDNQNALKALAGGPTAGGVYVKECRKDVKILQLPACEGNGKWTPSPKGIPGNEQPDTLATDANQLTIPCPWEQSTVSWLRARPHHRMREQWQQRYNLK